MSAAQLLPCPFCGEPGEYVGGLGHANCEACGAQGPWAPHKREAIEKWNARATAALADFGAELRAAGKYAQDVSDSIARLSAALSAGEKS